MIWSDRRNTLVRNSSNYGLVYIKLSIAEILDKQIVFRTSDKLIVQNDNGCCWLIAHATATMLRGIYNNILKHGVTPTVELFPLETDFDTAYNEITKNS